jgi:hypothetical protein
MDVGSKLNGSDWPYESEYQCNLAIKPQLSIACQIQGIWYQSTLVFRIIVTLSVMILMNSFYYHEVGSTTIQATKPS